MITEKDDLQCKSNESSPYVAQFKSNLIYTHDDRCVQCVVSRSTVDVVVCVFLESKVF